MEKIENRWYIVSCAYHSNSSLLPIFCLYVDQISLCSILEVSGEKEVTSQNKLNCLTTKSMLLSPGVNPDSGFWASFLTFGFWLLFKLVSTVNSCQWFFLSVLTLSIGHIAMLQFLHPRQAMSVLKCRICFYSGMPSPTDQEKRQYIPHSSQEEGQSHHTEAEKRTPMPVTRRGGEKEREGERDEERNEWMSRLKRFRIG